MRKFSTTTLALFASSLLAVGCGSSRPEVTAKNECIAGDDTVFVHALIRVNYTTGPIKTSRDLWQFSCTVSDKSCKGVSLTLDNLDRGHAITMMDLNRPEGAELVSMVGSVATIRWGPLRTFTIDFDRGAVTYVESGKNPLGASTEGRGEASCQATSALGRAAAVEPNYEREPQPERTPVAIPARREPPVMPASQPMSCFSISDPKLSWPVSICAFDAEGCRAKAARMGIAKATCQPADSMVCNQTINGLLCFGDMATCLLKTDTADCMEVRFMPLLYTP